MRPPFFHALFRLQGLFVSVLLLSLGGSPVFAAVNKDINQQAVKQQTAKKLSAKQLREVRQHTLKKSIATSRRNQKATSTPVARRKPVHVAARGRLVQRRVIATSHANPRHNQRAMMTSAARANTANAAASRRPDPQILKTALVAGAASSVVRATDKLQVSAASTAANEDPLFLRSGSALVVDEGTGHILLSKNADTARPIASLTKLMTAAVILDAHQPMDQVLEITDADIDTLKWSASRLRPGTRLTREEMLKLALMSSENRAAHALARNYPGGLVAFVAAMNAKARALGMNSTRYVEPTGLSPQNESTAHDLALLVKAAYHYPMIREFSTHPESEVDVGPRTLQFRNTDHLVFNRGWDILLQKTGYINEAGHCLVLQTKFEGRRIIVVLLDAWGKYSHFGDAQRIRAWLEARGFNSLHDPASTLGKATTHPTAEPGVVRTALVEKAPAALGE